MGHPKFLSCAKCPIRSRKPGEVLIRVKAIGVNFADLLQRMGLYPGSPKPPFVPGLEIAGVVEKSAAGGGASEGPVAEGGRRGDRAHAIQRLRGMGEPG